MKSKFPYVLRAGVPGALIVRTDTRPLLEFVIVWPVEDHSSFGSELHMIECFGQDITRVVLGRDL
jgi:hypothetical protein